MADNALYTDLSGYYDLMCAAIDYRAQSHCIQRLHRLFGNGGKRHLDLACGTGLHIRHFIDAGYQSTGLDLNQAMLERAAQRCPEAHFAQQDMCSFTLNEPGDLITCFLYSIHYSASIERLKACIAAAHNALAAGGVLCFNAVDKYSIDNQLFTAHSTMHEGSQFHFKSAWYYPGTGEQQQLHVQIERRHGEHTQRWQDQHPMVAVSFAELRELLAPYFEVQLLAHDYQKLVTWDGVAGNGLLVCVKT